MKMAHSYLVTNSDSSSRLKEARQLAENLLVRKIKNFFQNPDILFLQEEDSIKIEQIRQLQKELALKPISLPLKVALIHAAEKLTLPAQNALLKTLEEPPLKTILILTAPHPELLLPTIVSRCQIVKLTPSPSVPPLKEVITPALDFYQQIIPLGVGERLKLAQEIAVNRPKAQAFVETQTLLWRQFLLQKTPKITPSQVAKTLKNLQKAQKMLEGQVNPKLVVERFLLSYPRA